MDVIHVSENSVSNVRVDLIETSSQTTAKITAGPYPIYRESKLQADTPPMFETVGAKNFKLKIHRHF